MRTCGELGPSGPSGERSWPAVDRPFVWPTFVPRVIMGTGMPWSPGRRHQQGGQPPRAGAGAFRGRHGPAATRREVMAEAEHCGPGQGQADHGWGPVDAGRRPAEAVRRRGEHPLPGRVDELLLRLRPPAAVRVRRDPAQPGWGEPQQQEEGVTPGRPAAGCGPAGTARSSPSPWTGPSGSTRRPRSPGPSWPRSDGSLDDEVRIVVVRGEGRAFSAGLDRSLFTAAPGDRGRARRRRA